MMPSFSHLSPAAARTPVEAPVECPCFQASTSEDCCYPCVYEELEQLANSVSEDVIPGLQRQLSKVRLVGVRGGRDGREGG